MNPDAKRRNQIFNPLAQLATKECTDYLPDKFSVVEIGNQTFVGEGNTKDYYVSLGAVSYIAIDVNERMDAIICDLNYPLNNFLKSRRTSLVTNNGTSEHLFNQAQVFENIHILCNTNGLMLHILPLTPWINHGFYNYNPIFFRDLSRVNGYEILFYWIADRYGERHEVQPNEFDEIFRDKNPNVLLQIIDKIYKKEGFHEVFNVVCFRKINDDKFKYPMQGKYRKDVEGIISSS